MSDCDLSEHSNSEDSSNCLRNVLRTCANIQSVESLGPPVDSDYFYNDVYLCSPGNNSSTSARITNISPSIGKMISPNPYSISGNISTSSYASEDSFSDNIVEDNGRISLAYENLHTIPRRIADRFAAHTRCLDLSHNNFQNLSFLCFFEDLHTLILDRNSNLDVNTLPYLPSLCILWINNCDISNITDWIHRIERQCPSLEHLSIMGNPGIKTVFNTHYRDYIVQVLPQIKYLDGIPIYTPQSSNGDRITGSSSSSCGNVSTSTSSASDKNHQQQQHSPTLNFKDLFRMRQRKKYNTQYTNGSSTSTTTN